MFSNRVRPTRATLLAVFVLLLWPDGNAGLAQELPETVRIGVNIDTDYRDTPEALRQLETLLQVLPKTVDTLRAGESLEEYAVRRFGFGPTKQPEARLAFGYLVEDLRAANEPSLAAPTKAPRQILVPILPPRALQRPNASNPYNDLPKTQSWDFELLGPTGEEPVARQVSAIEDRLRRGSDSTFLTIEVPRAFAEQHREQLEQSDQFSMASEGVFVELGPTGGAGSSLPFLTAAEVTYLTAAALRRQRRTTLYVLDVSWPDAASQQATMDFLLPAINDWRQELGLARLSAAPQPLPVAAYHPHSILVGRALRELRQIDNDAAVRVVFIPLRLETASEAFWAPLLETAFVSARYKVAGQPSVSAEVLRPQAATDAEAVLRSLRAVTTPGSGLVTNRALIEAVYQLADAIAERDQTFWLISESWGVSTPLLKSQLPATAHGLTVAATGNDGEVFPGTVREFAARSLRNREFVGVINIDRSGALQCCSATVLADFEADANFLGSRGEVDGNCATSYAAPRVAWLLALSEATRAIAVNPALLVDKMGQHVRGLQGPGPGPARFQLEITACCNR